MRGLFAAVLVCAVVPTVTAQTPALTLSAALDEASSSNLELVSLRLRRASEGRVGLEASDPRDALRASELLGEVRRAYVEVSLARTGAAAYDAQAPILLEMSHTGMAPGADGEMRVHDNVKADVFARVAATRVTWQERVRLAEIRLTAALGRPPSTTIPALAALEPGGVPTAAEQTARMRDLRLAAAADDMARSAPNPERMAAARAARDVLEAAVRRRVLEGVTRVTAARERLAIADSTLLPQMESASDAARLAYASGQGTFEAMVSSYHRLLDARMDRAGAAADLDRARVELDIAMGETSERLAQALGVERD